MQVKIFSDELNEKAIELTKIVAKSALSEIENMQLIKTKNAIEELKDNMSRAQIRYDTSLERIKGNYCNHEG